ncbi:hypothetical protein KIPB_013236, partial [Kipferlia bialata]|eukprot:g13236.t1
MTTTLSVRIELPGNGRTLLEFSCPGDVDPCTPLQTVVAGIAPQPDEETSSGDSYTEE